MRIDGIENLHLRCTGCMACADVCPQDCIAPVIVKDGFRYAGMDTARCVNCGKCGAVCPLEKQKKHPAQHLYAAYAKRPEIRNAGSSGGVFELLADALLEQGYTVCGAAFDGLTLRHRLVHTKDELKPLLKSKYLQSDTTGIYKEVLAVLRDGGRVFFCGTPCQVTALCNVVPDALRDRLLTADIICHGVPSQQTFDRYIRSIEEKSGGRVSDFSFRVKDNRYRHAHGYAYTLTKNGRSRRVNGFYTQSSFYNAFKQYLFFREGCYICPFATPERAADLTLGDFWGIEKYDFDGDGDTDVGVSMVITHTDAGEAAFAAIEAQTVCRAYPIAYGIASNHCLSESTDKPANRDRVICALENQDYKTVAKAYFGESPVFRVYRHIPPFLRKRLRKGNRG